MKLVSECITLMRYSAYRYIKVHKQIRFDILREGYNLDKKKRNEKQNLHHIKDDDKPTPENKKILRQYFPV